MWNKFIFIGEIYFHRNFLVAELPPRRYFSTKEFIRFLWTVSSQRRGTRIETRLVILIFMLCQRCVVLRCVLEIVLELNWCFAICISRGLFWQQVCYLTHSSLLFSTNCVVVITEYWSSNHVYHQWIGRKNKMLEIKCTIEQWRSRFLCKKYATDHIFLGLGFWV